MSYHAWTKADVQVLRDMHARGMSLAAIAAVIGSTPGSTSQMCTRLGLNRGRSDCRYCDAGLTHADVGRKKQYCDGLCAQTHHSELQRAARRAPYLAGEKLCRHCGDTLTAFQQSYCSRVCGQAAWHRAVWDDPTRRARRLRMLKADMRRRARNK